MILYYYPIPTEALVFGLVSNWVRPWEVDSLDEEYLPGIIDDAISYAVDDCVSENAQ